MTRRPKMTLEQHAEAIKAMTMIAEGIEHLWRLAIKTHPKKSPVTDRLQRLQERFNSLRSALDDEFFSGHPELPRDVGFPYYDRASNEDGPAAAFLRKYGKDRP